MQTVNPVLVGGRVKTTPSPTHFFEELPLFLLFLHGFFTQGTKFYISHFSVKKFSYLVLVLHSDVIIKGR